MDNHEQGVVPGFRFHPTDEEIVSFYLRKKIEKKLGTRIDQFIKQMDIYKYDPWDLPKNSDSSVTDMEWYFFCKRGRKYRNSIRPNRVTGSGFWKATGIDKAIYSSERGGQCIGLKKSLVFYRGSAGKGTKTDWMMHEFRLPDTVAAGDRKKTTTPANANAVDDQQVEVWTLCRILKKNMSYRKSANATAPADHLVWKTTTDDWENFFGGPEEGTADDDYNDHDQKMVLGGGGGDHKYMNEIINRKHVVSSSDRESSSSSSSSSTSTALISDEAREFFAHGNWDEMVSAAAAMDEHEYAFDHFLYSRNIAFPSI